MTTSPDTLDKVIPTYFAAVTRVPFVFRGKRYVPKPLDVLPCLFRGYGCPAGCGACCPRFSLVYLPTEAERGPDARPEVVEFNGRKVMLFVDRQAGNRGHHCRHVRATDGRCLIHGRQPFSCDFEIVRFKHYKDHTEIGTLFYGRGWNMLRIVDNARGALCTMEGWTEDVRADLLRKFHRLDAWTKHFGLTSTKLADMIRVVEAGPFAKSTRVP